MRGEVLEQGTDAPPCGFDGSLVGLSEQCLELGEGLFDRIEVWTIGRQEEQLCADSANGAAHGFSLVATEIVDDDDIAGSELWNECLFDIGQEAFAIDRSVNDGTVATILQRWPR